MMKRVAEKFLTTSEDTRTEKCGVPKISKKTTVYEYKEQSVLLRGKNGDKRGTSEEWRLTIDTGQSTER